MLISGDQMSGGNNKQCFIPIFNHQNSFSDHKNRYKIGTIMMQKYYTVFDMTPAHEYGKEYLRMGFGLQDPDKEDQIGEDDMEKKIDFLSEYLLYFYVATGVLLLLIAGFCISTYIQMKKKRNYRNQSKTNMRVEAEKIMSSYKDDMILYANNEVE